MSVSASTSASASTAASTVASTPGHAINEFALIARYFDRPARRAVLGIGDDCALLAPRTGRTLAVSTDLLIADRHFFADADPASIGWKTLAVNLSDLAAMGATPLAFTLAAALPTVDEDWLAAFSRGLFECADAYDCELIGGDTTRGPLTLCVTVMGDVAEGLALRRDAAEVGDDLWVSGSLGGAREALDCDRRRRRGEGPVVDRALLDRLDRPVPRVALGMGLASIAHAAIDVSDGLAQDLGHVLDVSHRGAVIELDRLPIDTRLRDHDRNRDRAAQIALAGGDDYELCFTAPSGSRDAIHALGRAVDTSVTRIGRIDDGRGLRLVDGAGVDRTAWFDLRGFDHFA